MQINGDHVVCCVGLPWNDSNTVFIHPTGAMYSSEHQLRNKTVTQPSRLVNNDSTSTDTNHYLLTDSMAIFKETLSTKQNDVA